MSIALDPARWPNADDLLDRALALAPADRDAFLHKAAGDDAALLAALRAVIAEADRHDGFLEAGGALSGALGGELAELLEPRGQPAALHPGSKIETYEIIDIIGRGGMGEVYRARDTRLHRDVALKVLPAHLAQDRERVSRFRREARALASLNHPGIGGIYGVAEQSGREALVLELVEGPTLAERLERGSLPVDEALAIGRRLAEAIAAAHARGILHRDLKPANIKVAGDGAVKILDFGLAKALGADPAASDANLSAQSPGLLLGTAAYMSPDRIKGRPADERADIWAFGCVLFEMLTGTRAFPGGSVREVIARVLEREPAFGLLPSATPAPIRRLLRRCLEKDPTRRLGYIGDAILEFDEAAAPSLDDLESRRLSWPRIGAGLAILVAMLAAAAFLLRAGPTASPPVSRLVLPLPAGDVAVTSFQPLLAISPDGRTIVYRARRNGVVQLFRRNLQELEPQAIPGTENGTGPFFSPDGRWIGFDGDGVLKRAALTGGAPVAICPAPGGVTATWLADDSIVFATNTGRVLQRVAASGGEAAPLTSLDQARGDTLHLLPQALPDGRSLLFTIVSGATRHVAVRLPSGDTRIVTEGTHGRYLPPGYLLFWREGSLWGGRFDPARMTLSGPAAPLQDDVQHTDGTVLHLDVTRDGTLVYLPAGAESSLQRLVWIDRDGRESPAGIDPGPFTRVALSPDGTRIALTVRERGNTDVWVADTARQTMSRLTFEPTIETMPTWSPDGASIAFRSEREGPGIFRRDAAGAGPIERITETDGPIHSPYSWTPDGRTLLFAVFRSFRQQAIASITPPDREIRVLLDGSFAQLDPHVSPDGRWLAYQSDESGRFEIYVRPYPAVQGARWQVSTSGATSPRWSPDGGELFFVDDEGLMAAPIRPGDAFSFGPARRLFPVKPFGGRLGADFEVSPDGRRFLFILAGPAGAARPAHLVFVQNWVEELREELERRGGR